MNLNEILAGLGGTPTNAQAPGFGGLASILGALGGSPQGNTADMAQLMPLLQGLRAQTLNAPRLSPAMAGASGPVNPGLITPGQRLRGRLQ